MENYNHLNCYLKEKFGERVLKICVDGNFTCPNRDGKKGVGGCIYCSSRGSGEHLNSTISITEQIKTHLESYRGKRANKFIVYFQNFTNTYDSIENLKKKYDEALSVDERIIGIDIDTRPDCISEDVAKLLYSYKKKYYVIVELGLQTVNEDVGRIINRCYSNADFLNAVNILNNYNIDIVTHIMLGLPYEKKEDIVHMVEFLNKINIMGIKIHSTYVLKDTKLLDMYKEGKYLPITLDKYLEDVTYIITHIRDDIVICRISGDAPRSELVAPEWNIHKKKVLNGIENKFKKENLYQGMYYKA